MKLHSAESQYMFLMYILARLDSNYYFISRKAPKPERGYDKLPKKSNCRASYKKSNYVSALKIKFILLISSKNLKKNYINLLEGGLHPNTKGHEKIFEIVKNHLTKNQII